MTSSTADKYTTTEYGKQNMFGAEVAPWVDENDNYEGYAVNAEKTNGRWAMIGFVALLGAYLQLVKSFQVYFNDKYSNI